MSSTADRCIYQVLSVLVSSLFSHPYLQLRRDILLSLQKCNQECIFCCTYNNTTAALSSWAIPCLRYSKLVCLLHGCLAARRYAVIQHTPHFPLLNSDLVILFSPVMEGCSSSGLVCFVSSRMQSGKKKKWPSKHAKLLKENFVYRHWKIRCKVLKTSAESSLTSSLWFTV